VVGQTEISWVFHGPDGDEACRLTNYRMTREHTVVFRDALVAHPAISDVKASWAGALEPEVL
jgi:hypothetical protein